MRAGVTARRQQTRGRGEGSVRFAESIDRFLVGFEGQCQVVVDVGPVGEPFGGSDKIFARLGKMTQRKISAATKFTGFAVLGGELNYLVESGQRLIGLVAASWIFAIAKPISALLGSSSVVRKYSAIALSVFPWDSSKWPRHEVSPRPMGVDLDRRLETCFRADASSPLSVSTCPSPIKAST